MEKKIRISLAGLAGSILALGVVLSVYLAQSNAEAEQLCQNIVEAIANTEGKMEAKEPMYLPNGFRMICADGAPEVLLLFYGKGDPIEKEKANRVELVENGAIFVGAKRFDPETDDAYYTKDRKAEIKKTFDGVDPKVETYLTEINGNLAAVRESCEDCGKSFITYENGTTVQVGTFSMPSVVVFYDGDQQYRIEGYVPAAELEKVAQSLR